MCLKYKYCVLYYVCMNKKSDRKTKYLRWGSGVCVSGVGFVTALCHLDHLFEDLSRMPVVSSVVFPLLLSVALLGGGYWLGQSTDTGEQAVKVAIWSVFGAIVLTLAGMAIAVFQNSVAAPGSRPAIVILPSSVTEGAAIGFVIGIYTIWKNGLKSEMNK